MQKVLLISGFILAQCGFISTASRKFNIPDTFSGTGDVFSLGADGKTLTETQDFIQMRISVDLDLASNSLGKWTTDASGKKVQTFVEQNFMDYYGGFGIDYKPSRSEVCDQYDIPSDQHVEELLDNMNNPYQDSTLVFAGIQTAPWNHDESFHVFNRVSAQDKSVTQQIYYSEKTGLLRYSVLLPPNDPTVFDFKNVFVAPQTELRPRDFAIKECLQ